MPDSERWYGDPMDEIDGVDVARPGTMWTMAGARSAERSVV